MKRLGYIFKIVANNLWSRGRGQLSLKFRDSALRKMNNTSLFILFS
jgi:hypothetical protein